jgi:hypothetical protein
MPRPWLNADYKGGMPWLSSLNTAMQLYNSLLKEPTCDDLASKGLNPAY